MKNTALVVWTLSLALTACSSDGGSPATTKAAADSGPDQPVQVAGVNVQDGCNPIAHEHDCLFPYPSDVFRTNGADGPRVEIGGAAQVKTNEGRPVEILNARPADGFGPHPAIVVRFRGGVDANGLTGPETEEGRATLLIEADSGTQIPHIAEVYQHAEPDLQLLALRPLSRLKDETRYVVALRGLKQVDGSEIVAPSVYAAIRDDLALASGLAGLKARYDESIFPVLDRAGVERADTTLAWEFTTRSRQNLVGDMLDVVEQTREWLDSDGPQIGELAVVADVDAGYDFVIEGTFTAPLFTQTDAPGTALRRDAQDKPTFDSVVPVKFRIQVPPSVVAAGGDARFVQFGHGFFGSCDEIISPVQLSFADDLGVVMGCVEWAGMAKADRLWVAEQMAAAPDGGLGFAPRVHQAMVNQVVFSHVAKTALRQTMVAQIDGTPAWNQEQYFMGISQGHILGGVLMALTEIERGALNVGGASFGLIMTRAHPFQIFDVLLKTHMDRLNILKYQVVGASALDPIDPVSYAPLVITEPLVLPHRVLMQAGVGDTSVPNLATEIHARSLGISLLSPSPRKTPYIQTVRDRADSALVYYDFGSDPMGADPWAAVAGPNDTHEAVRRTPEARAQIDRFFQPDGVVEQVCDGPCVLPFPIIE